MDMIPIGEVARRSGRAQSAIRCYEVEHECNRPVSLGQRDAAAGRGA